MTQTETVNLFIKLREEGWDDTKIADLIIFMATNIPSAEQAEEAKKNQQIKGGET